MLISMHTPVCRSGSTSESVGAEPSSAEPGYRLEHLSDTDLLAGTRRLVGRQNQVLAELLAHLAEVEARGVHRLRACPSLYAYCLYELRMSEDAAFRRARVARLARRFPVIFQKVADGELHLTALVLLAPHLTEENHRELLALAKHRTKREVLRLVRRLAPEPGVPDRIEPLGPESVGIPIPRPPSWRTLVESLAAGVRELPPGDRPKDWVDRAGAAQDVASSEPPTRATPADAGLGSVTGTYVDECGNRCRETRLLELHHLHAHARGGGETALNLTLRCAAHNGLAAEEDFGREFMRERSRTTTTLNELRVPGRALGSRAPSSRQRYAVSSRAC